MMDVAEPLAAIAASGPAIFQASHSSSIELRRATEV
jgi:hypothetical protein